MTTLFCSRLTLATITVLLSSCAPTPGYYGIPTQHKPIEASGPQPSASVAFGEFFKADDINSDEYLIKDVKPLEGAVWRWTLAEPEFRFFLKSAQARRFHMEFGINDRTFVETGPLKMEILINGKPFDALTFPSSGSKTYDKPVPASFLLPDAENHVIVRILNPWQAPDPGVKLGIVLRLAGFLPA